jgi:hypothetical protein
MKSKTKTSMKELAFTLQSKIRTLKKKGINLNLVLSPLFLIILWVCKRDGSQTNHGQKKRRQLAKTNKNLSKRDQLTMISGPKMIPLRNHHQHESMQNL